MLRDEVVLFTELSGRDGEHTPIGVIGAYLDGYEKGKEEGRQHGKWSDESKDSLLCSACGKRVYKPFIGGFPTERTSHYYPNFCAFCGADMRGNEE